MPHARNHEQPNGDFCFSPQQLLHSLAATDRVSSGGTTASGPPAIEQKLSSSPLERAQDQGQSMASTYGELRSCALATATGALRRCARQIHLPRSTHFAPELKTHRLCGRDEQTNPIQLRFDADQPGNNPRVPSALRSGRSGYKAWTTTEADLRVCEARRCILRSALQSNAWGSNEHFLGSPMTSVRQPCPVCHDVLRADGLRAALGALKPGRSGSRSAG